MPTLTTLANLLYPPACLLCDAPLSDAGAVCGRCDAALPRAGAPLCRRCGAEIRGAFDAVLECAGCRRHPRAFDAARAPWRYAGPAREAVHRFKYGRRRRLGGWLAADMARTARAALPCDERSIIVPVPLHWLKLRLAGRNHAEELARALSRALGAPCVPKALARRRWTRPQTRLSGRARLRNVRHAFTASSRLVCGRTVLLVDDVLTSGATAEACACALKTAGARAVYVLTAARTPLE